MQVSADVTSTLVAIGIPAILGLQGWVVKKIGDFDVKFSRLDTWAFGPNGQNGANSRIIALEHDVDDVREDGAERRHNARRRGDPQ